MQEKIEKLKQFLLEDTLAYVADFGRRTIAISLEVDGLTARDSSGKAVVMEEILSLLGMETSMVYGARGLPKGPPITSLNGDCSLVNALHKAVKEEKGHWCYSDRNGRDYRD